MFKSIKQFFLFSSLKLKTITSKKSLFALSLALLFLYSALIVFAIPPASPYSVGDNITDPSCPPNSLNCYVSVVTADNGLTATGANVQLGGTLLQNTIINQNGNDLNITNGNFRFENDSDLLGFGISGIGLTYRNGTEQSLIGMVDDPAGRYPALYYYNSGAGYTLERTISTGDTGIEISNTETLAGTIFRSSAGFGGSSNQLSVSNEALNELVDIDMTVNNTTAANGIRLSHENVTTTGNAYFVNINSETGVTFDSYVGNSYTFPLSDGSTNQVLSTNGSGQLSWMTVSGGGSLPTQTGHAGEYLTTDGTNPSWTTIAGGGSALQLYSENPSLPYTSPVASGLNSVAIGNGAQASADDMIVWGKNAGFGSLSSTQSTFLGANAGVGVSGASSINNTFIGANAGYTTSNLYDSIFIGSNTGFGSSNSHYSNFIGQSAGYGADNSDNSTFIGQYTGFRAIGASKSIFVGFTAGADSVNSYNTVAIGDSAGKGSQSQNSNFLGDSAGKQSTSTVNSNFFGSFAGSGSTTILDSVLMGSNAGSSSTNIRYSNLLGYYAGASSTKIYNSNFIGQYAGYSATNASNSIFIGTNSGSNDLVNNTTNPDDFSILLGNNTSTGGFSNSIALGSYATNTLSNQFMIGSTTRPIDETKIIGSLGTECTITTGTGMACTSDERLKTNITDLNSDTLSKLQNVRTVSYNWLQNPNSSTQIGFLAQNLEQYFPEMVMTDATGKKQVYYSQMTPILVEAIRELNVKIGLLSPGGPSTTVFDGIKAWLGDAQNGIAEVIAGTLRARDQICIDDVCMSKEQLRVILQNNTAANSIPTTTSNILLIDTTQDDTAVSPSSNQDQTENPIDTTSQTS